MACSLIEDDEDEEPFRQVRSAAGVTPGSRAKAKPRRRDRFVMVPLWWAEQAAKATRTPRALVWVWLLHLAWKTKGSTFPLPNAKLGTQGISPKVKRQTLRGLEAAGLIRVDWRAGKTPIVTLLYL
jgi:hypothetical protein